jgi:hypothetical protein
MSGPALATGEGKEGEGEGPPGKRVREGPHEYQEVQLASTQGGATAGPCAKSRPAGLPWQATAAGEAGNSGPLHRWRREERWGSHGRALSRRREDRATMAPGAPPPQIELPWRDAG